jgi:hypothetical protein
MASSRRTYDTDTITIRTVFAKTNNNSNIPPMNALLSDGRGGTFWGNPSTLALNPSFNQIITSARSYTADLSYNRFSFLSGAGIGMSDGYPASNTTNIFAKAFQTIDVSGGNTLSAYSNGYLNPTLKFASEGNLQIHSDPLTNTFFIRGPMSMNTISTGIYGYSQILAVPSLSTPVATANQQPGSYLTATSPSTLLTFAGIDDIQLSTNVTTNTVFISISSFTSKGYFALSGEAYSVYARTISSLSANFVLYDTFASSVSSLSTSYAGISNVLFSTLNWLAISTGEQFLTLTGLINARATIAQLNDDVATISRQQTSTVKGLGTAGYISSPLTTISTLSSLMVNGPGLFSSVMIWGGGAYPTSTNSAFNLTVLGEGTVGRIGGTTWTTISDQRVKTNIEEANYEICYNDIKTIPLHRFTYTSSFFDTFNMADKNTLGFVAQEVKNIHPKSITVNPILGMDDTLWLNTDQLNMSLYGAVKKVIADKEAAESTIVGQGFQLLTLQSTVYGILNR